MQFEDILAQIGDEGPFQIWLMALLLLPTSLFNPFYDSIILMATPDHWCRVSDLEKLPQSVQQQLIRPANSSGKDATCFRYDINYQSIRSMTDLQSYLVSSTNYSTLGEVPVVRCSDGYLYDQSLYSETPISWYNFVCDHDYYANNILSLSLIGLAVLTPIISNLSDRIGRRKTLLLTFTLAVLCCANPLVFKNLPSFIIVRFIAGGVINVYYQLPFVMTQELVSQRYRTRSSCLSAIFYSLGSCLMPVIAKLTGDWWYFTLVQFFLTVPYCLSYKWLPESPFWLISKRRYAEAYKELERIAKINGRPVPPTLMSDIQSLEDKSIEDGVDGKDKESNSNHKDNFTELFFLKGLRGKTVIITFVFIACLIGYGGIAYNTINLEATSQLYNFLILSMVDIPALILFWYLLDTRLGRRWTDVFGLALCGFALIAPSFAPDRNSETVLTVCTVIGKFGIAGVYMVVYQHASELFPTTLRNQGIGLCATISSLVGISVPQLVYMAKFGAWIPLAIIGSICLFAAFLASFLPETLNEYLPQRASDSAVFGQGRPYFSLATMTKESEKKSEKQSSIPVIKIELDAVSTNNNNNNIVENNGKLEAANK